MARDVPVPDRLQHAVVLALLLAGGLSAQAGAEELEEFVVTGRLREQPLERVPASISVLPAQLIERRHAAHLEELLNAAPNVNFNLGASRGRFVQLRGIGEREQFVDPLDPSVGLYIDGIDFSGLGNAGTLHDVEQVEILRGPQGTAFGASAMAGLINIRTAAPGDRRELTLRAGGADYGGRTLGFGASAPLGAPLGARVSLEQHTSDGYVENDWQGAEDTNEIDERTARVRLSWRPAEDWEVDLSALALDADNGYDAWSLDNTRHTLSDQPGRDRQQSAAGALHTRWSGWEVAAIELTATLNDTELDYGYDEDWSNADLCPGTPCEGWEYASTDRYLRDVNAASLDLRLLSREGTALGWVAGLYTTRRETALERRYTYLPAPFESDYEARRDAVYGELAWDATGRLRIQAGLRAERFEADYDDTIGTVAAPGEWLNGGQLSAQFQLADASMVYALVSRGFKAGGVNGEAIGKAQQGGFDPEVIEYLQTQREFESEALWNHELGLKTRFAGERAWLRTALFWMERDDVQLKAWYNKGPQFVGYTGNAASGRNRGAELELGWQPLDALRFEGSLGVLDTRIENFAADDPDTPEFALIDRSGRDQAQAPNWQFHVAAEWEPWPRWYARAEYEGKDAYYFSDSNDERSSDYALLHLAAGWQGERLAIDAYVHNALDEEYAVHGFYFGNDPRTFYANQPWYQLGAPRVAGLALSYRFGE